MRGARVSREAIRLWINRFGQHFAQSPTIPGTTGLCMVAADCGPCERSASPQRHLSGLFLTKRLFSRRDKRTPSVWIPASLKKHSLRLSWPKVDTNNPSFLMPWWHRSVIHFSCMVQAYGVSVKSWVFSVLCSMIGGDLRRLSTV